MEKEFEGIFSNVMFSAVIIIIYSSREYSSFSFASAVSWQPTGALRILGVNCCSFYIFFFPEFKRFDSVQARLRLLKGTLPESLRRDMSVGTLSLISFSFLKFAVCDCVCVCVCVC
jgi:hypothetical protein